MKLATRALVRRVFSLGLVCALCSAMLGAADAKPVRIVGTKVSIEQPPGFLPAKNFTGLEDEAHGASIMVTEIPGPYSQVTAGFSQQGLAGKGMRLISRQPAKIGVRDGLYVEAMQSASGVEYHKWISAFGDETFTVLVTANVPESYSGQLGPLMKKTVLSVNIDASAAPQSPTAGMSFSVALDKQLKFASRMQNMLILTPTGTLQGNDGTMFVAGQSLESTDITDQDSYARERLLATAGFSQFQIEAEKKVAIAGLPGVEIVASAVGKRGEKVFINQTMLFGLGNYFIMQGITDYSKRQTWEPTFYALQGSFKLK